MKRIRMTAFNYAERSEENPKGLVYNIHEVPYTPKGNLSSYFISRLKWNLSQGLIVEIKEIEAIDGKCIDVV